MTDICERLNTRLYEKMFAEQQQYRAWLLSRPPEEILNHAYEYTSREDILLSFEYNDLTTEQVKALLRSRTSLGGLFQDYEKLETNHMETVWDTVVRRADTEIEKLRESTILKEMCVPER